MQKYSNIARRTSSWQTKEEIFQWPKYCHVMSCNSAKGAPLLITLLLRHARHSLLDSNTPCHFPHSPALLVVRSTATDPSSSGSSGRPSSSAATPSATAGCAALRFRSDRQYSSRQPRSGEKGRGVVSEGGGVAGGVAPGCRHAMLEGSRPLKWRHTKLGESSLRAGCRRRRPAGGQGEGRQVEKPLLLCSVHFQPPAHAASPNDAGHGSSSQSRLP